MAGLRAARDEREARAMFAAELDAQGIAIYGDRSYVPWTLALENLRDDDGNQISPEAEGTYWSAYGAPAAARYLAWLAAHTSYGLSGIEAEVAAHATAGSSEPAGATQPGPDADQPENDSADPSPDQDEDDQTASTTAS